MTPSLRHPVLATACLALLTCTASSILPTHAAAQDRVVVVPANGTTTLPLYGITPHADGGFTVTSRETLDVIPPPRGPQRIRDVKVLPDGSFLLAGLDEEGVAQSDPDAGTLEFLWISEARFTRIESASVGAYDADGAIRRLVITDSNASLLTLWDVETEAPVLRQSLLIPGSRAIFSQAITLPGGRLITATNWSSVGVFGLDIIDVVGGPAADARRIANREHGGAPTPLALQPALDEVREVMALDEETFLVTTRYTLLGLDLAGDILWSYDLRDDPSLGGEFGSARALPSGRIAAVTYEPGKWNVPHPNHRILWFARQGAPTTGLERLAVSEALTAAPLRVAAAAGTGGTGTLGYQAVLGEGATGDVANIALADSVRLDRSTIAQGESVMTSVTFRNTAAEATTAPRLLLEAIPSTNCLPEDDAPRALVSRSDVVFAPLATNILSGNATITADFPPGTWCVYPAIERADGSRRALLAGGAALTVTSPGDGGIMLPSEDLNLRVDPPDMGMTTRDMTVIDIPQDHGGGCACHTPGNSSEPPYLWLWLGLMGCLWGWGWRRRR